jgi:hypothetical protein
MLTSSESKIDTKDKTMHNRKPLPIMKFKAKSCISFSYTDKPYNKKN